MTTPTELQYERIVVKISGESLCGDGPLDRSRMSEVARSIAGVHALGVGLVVVVGGGNLFRGPDGVEWEIDPWQADQAGMLATGINVVLLAGILDRMGVPTETFSRGACIGVGLPYTRREVCTAVDEKRVAFLAGGMGISGVSTDVPAVHAAVDVQAEAIIMAKHGIDGVYDADPNKAPAAKFLPELAASEALARKLAVMDTPALALALAHNKRIHVIPASEPDGVRHVLEGKEIGSLILPT